MAGRARGDFLSAMARRALAAGAATFYLPEPASGLKDLPHLLSQGTEGAIAGTRRFPPILLRWGRSPLEALPRPVQELARSGRVALELEAPPELPNRERWWGVDRCGRIPTAADLAEDEARGARFVRLRGNLLSRAEERAAIAAADSRPMRVVLSDVWDGGRLDGRGLGSRSPAARGPPPPLRQLKAEWARALSLRFLTEGGQTTLRRAALDYAAHLAPHGLLLLEAETPEELNDLGGGGGLSESTVRAIEQVADGRKGPGPAGGVK